MRIPRFAVGAVLRQDAARGDIVMRGVGSQLHLPWAAVEQWSAARVGEAAGASAAAASRGAQPGAQPGAHWDERPAALVEGGRLRAVTAAAGQMRIRAGMTVAEARARCATLELREWDDALVERAVTETTAALLVASPQVTPVAGAPGVWWVGAGGLDGIGGERSLVRTLLRVARLWHPRPRVAVASSCVAARAATWMQRPTLGAGCWVLGDGAGAAGAGDDADYSEGVPLAPAPAAVIVPRNRCAEFLAAAPLGLLPMDDELRIALHALGLRTAGAFAALDAGDVEQRWGRVGLVAWRLARGEDRRRPVLTKADARHAVSVELAMPAATAEPVLFLVRAALDRLVAALVAEGRAAAAVALTLTLDDGRGALPSGGVARTVTREARLARPLARAGPLFEQCRSLLERFGRGAGAAPNGSAAEAGGAAIAARLPAPVCGVTVSIPATAPLSGEQGGLLDAAWRDPAAVEAALERLRAELGPNVVVRPVTRDEHRPERAGAWEERWVGAEDDVRGGAGVVGRGRRVPESSAEASAGAALPPYPAALRLLETPEPVEVERSADTEAPVAVWWRGRRIPVERAAGPERLSGDWWRDAFRRDYWRCAASGGGGSGGGHGELVLFVDRAGGGGWYVQGWYD
ncbi:MAG TPA: hypothetical protein VKA84_10910 [Gemmatimonadaceae bacterium]|nr:hypothetical protein [Gemmatimonadaceae bacterium]